MTRSAEEPDTGERTGEQGVKAKCLKVLAAAQISGDTEAAHARADDALIEFLRAIGHGDIADEWEKVDKWYA